LARRVTIDDELAACLEQNWHLADARIRRHDGGMGSRTWIVEQRQARWVAKMVSPEAAGPLAGGLQLAQRLDRAGIPAGAPVPSRTGDLTVPIGDGYWLALLTWVPGTPLTGEGDEEQAVIGGTLARVHAVLQDFELASAERFHWVDPGAGYLSLRPWLRPAVSAAVAALDEARPGAMTWGLLHADPAPGAFRLDPETGRCGVIDWSYAVVGPLVYDLASAVMYVGRPENASALIASYLDGGMIGRGEVDAGLLPLLRFRWAVQANYFAWRIATNNLTGISGPEDNEAGLEDARLSLRELG
jgi:Ser/Thr protein kinase RdoA (MazF antagonist)